jgi:hypothetical protein
MLNTKNMDLISKYEQAAVDWLLSLAHILCIHCNGEGCEKCNSSGRQFWRFTISCPNHWSEFDRGCLRCNDTRYNLVEPMPMLICQLEEPLGTILDGFACTYNPHSSDESYSYSMIVNGKLCMGSNDSRIWALANCMSQGCNELGII